MRNLYFLLFILFTAHFTTLAQRQVNLQMIGMKVGSSATNTQLMGPYYRLYHDNKTEYFFAFVFKNLGPDPLLKFDTVTVSYANGTQYTGNHFIANAGDTISFVPNLGSAVFYMPFGASLPSADTMYWCDTVWVSAGPTNSPLIDPDPANNIACHWVEAYYDWRLGVDDLSSRHNELLVFPNPASTSLTIKHTYNGFAKKAKIILRNILGAEVYTQTVQTTSGTLTHTADISYLPAGLYTAEVHYNGRTIIQKFSVQ
ncbi:T9SS type A sorting domain-containing protein [Polluticoccus soli]|uniref:T9SS type A sorting domain-containing protein n=1 Tax=Polluticoccus soli TaxID=3034150 RepID=UPI0023E2BFC5|nr:T9SS type A sorting domain-containing protein [Flavipsychrobacter sp. JY13-12]